MRSPAPPIDSGVNDARQSAASMKFSDLAKAGHWPTLLSAFIYLVSSLGFSKGLTGSYSIGFLVFSGLCIFAIAGLGVVKTRWRTTWGALAQARV